MSGLHPDAPIDLTEIIWNWLRDEHRASNVTYLTLSRALTTGSYDIIFNDRLSILVYDAHVALIVDGEPHDELLAAADPEFFEKLGKWYDSVKDLKEDNQRYRFILED